MKIALLCLAKPKTVLENIDDIIAKLNFFNCSELLCITGIGFNKINSAISEFFICRTVSPNWRKDGKKARRNCFVKIAKEAEMRLLVCDGRSALEASDYIRILSKSEKKLDMMFLRAKPGRRKINVDQK